MLLPVLTKLVFFIILATTNITNETNALSWDTLKDLGNTVSDFDKAKDLAGSTTNYLGSTASDLIGSKQLKDVGNSVSDFAETLGSEVSSLGDTVNKFARTTADKASDIASDTANYLVLEATDLGNTVINLAGNEKVKDLEKTVSDFAETIEKEVLGLGSSLKEFALSTANYLVETVLGKELSEKTSSDLGEKVIDIENTAIDFEKNSVADLGHTVQGVGNKLKGALTVSAEEFNGYFKGLVRGLQGIPSYVQQLVGKGEQTGHYIEKIKLSTMTAFFPQFFRKNMVLFAYLPNTFCKQIYYIQSLCCI